MADKAGVWRRSILGSLVALVSAAGWWGGAEGAKAAANVFTLAGTRYSIDREAFDPRGIEVSGRQDAVLLILSEVDVDGTANVAADLGLDVARAGWGNRVEALLRPLGQAGASQAFLARVLASVIDPSSDAVPPLQLGGDAEDGSGPGLPIVLNPPARPEGGFAELRQSRDIFLDGRADAIGTVLWCLKPKPDNNPTCQMTFVEGAVAYQLDFDRAQVAQWRHIRDGMVGFMARHRVGGD